MATRIGTMLGPFEILAPLGSGGMGEVYRARDTRLEREVALKVLPREALRDEDANRRFRSEALHLSQLNHPHVATIFDFDRHEGTAYIAMELVAGDTLETRIKSGPIEIDDAVRIGIEMAEGVTAAHDKGVIHRDLKPANLRFAADGRLKVLDFGLARLATIDPSAGPTMTQTSGQSISGTLAYIAPEVLAGRSPNEAGDVYAMGVVLYEILTGRRPYEADAPLALMYSILNHDPAPPRTLRPKISADLEALVLHAIARDPARRSACASAFLADLRRIQGAEETLSGIAATTAIHSLVVLPLENHSGDPAQEFFSDGMTEELIIELSKLKDLRVISRTSAMRYKGVRKPLSEIGAELRVDAVVEGSVVRSGDRVRVTARLLRASSEEQLWGDRFERAMTDILSLQAELSRAIGAEVNRALHPEGAGESKSTTTKTTPAQVNVEAYEKILRGRHLLHHRTEEGLKLAIQNATEAIALDPNQAEGHSLHAQAHALMGFLIYRDPNIQFPHARKAALLALELDEEDGDAMATLAYATLYHEWNPVESKKLFERAIKFDSSSATAMLWYANSLTVLGEFEQARVQLRRQLELDPMSPMGSVAPGWVSFFAREYDRADDEFRRALELEQTFPIAQTWHALTLLHQGRAAEALAKFELSLRLDPTFLETKAGLACAAAALGDTTRARAVLQDIRRLSEHQFLPAFYPGFVLGALGDLDEAFIEMNKAVDQRIHWLVLIDHDPRLDPLRKDPRFTILRNRIYPPGESPG